MNKFEKRELVNDGRLVMPIGIGGGYGVSGKALELAFERGINYFFWAPIFPTYYPMTKWLKEKFKKDRDKIILGTATYFWKVPGSLERTLNRHLGWLRTDYIDYFHLGMIRSIDKKAIETLFEFKQRGMIRHISFSSHNRVLSAELTRSYQFDLAMIRYNSAHRGAEKEFFPYVDSSRLNVVAFNATRHKSLLSPKIGWNKPLPRACDCYRFVLSHPKVSICVAGPSKDAHIRDIFDAIEKGPMSEEELEWMREFGDFVYGNR